MPHCGSILRARAQPTFSNLEKIPEFIILPHEINLSLSSGQNSSRLGTEKHIRKTLSPALQPDGEEKMQDEQNELQEKYSKVASGDEDEKQEGAEKLAEKEKWAPEDTEPPTFTKVSEEKCLVAGKAKMFLFSFSSKFKMLKSK